MISHPKDDKANGKTWSRNERYAWLLALCCGTAALYGTRSTMPLCNVSISREFGWSKSQSGTVLSAFFWGYAITQVLGGYLSDRFGGEIVIVIAAAGWSLVTFWTPYLLYVIDDAQHTLTLVVLSRALVGCLQGVHYPSMSSILSKCVLEEERAFSFSLASAGGYIGVLLNGSLGSILLASYGWHIPFYFNGLFSMAWLLCVRYFLIEESRRKELIKSLSSMNVSSIPINQQDTVPWMLFVKNKCFWAMIASHFCHTWAYFMILNWAPTYFEETFKEAQGWVFNVVPWVIAIVVSTVAGYFTDNLINSGMDVTKVRKLAVGIDLIGMTSMLLLLSITDHYIAALLFVTLCLGFGSFHVSGTLVNPQDLAPKYAGSVFGIMNMAGAIPGFIGVYITGHTLEVTHSWASVYMQAACVTATGAFIYLVWGSGKRIVDN